MTDEKIKQILELKHHIKQRIGILTNEFIKVQSDFIKELQQIVKKSLETEDDFIKTFSLILENRFNVNNIQLVFCGPNSSGKSSFIHAFLKIGTILPAAAGPVTARITKLTYASADQACLNIYSSIKARLSQEAPITSLTLSQFFENNEKPDWVGIRNEISVHLERPTDLSEDAFNKWVKCFVEIQIPSPILVLGIDVYDTPGLLFYDKLSIKDNLYELVKTIKPILIFMYENSTVADDAYQCFLGLKSILGNLQDSSIFFLNTKQDVMTLFAGAGMSTSQTRLMTEAKFNEILPNEREKRLNLLLKVPVMTNDLHGNDNFDICSLPQPRSILPKCATQITDSAILHIIQFTVNTDLKQPFYILNKILNLIEKFFHFFFTISHREQSQWEKIRNDAISWGEKFFNKFQEEMTSGIDLAYTNILHRFDQCSTNISERAVRLDRFNDPSEKINSQLTTSGIKHFIEIAIQEEVIKVAVNEIIKKIIDELRLSIKHEIAIHLDNNELLLAAQRQVLLEISAIELEQRTWLESLLLTISMVPTAIGRLFKSMIVRYDVKHWNEAMLNEYRDKQHYDEYNEILDSHEYLINPDKRKDFAESYLGKMRLNIEEQETLFKRNLKEWITNRQKTFFENIHSNYNSIIKHLPYRNLAYEKTNSYLGIFARLQCQLLAVKHLQDFHGQIPIVDTSVILGQGAFFYIHPAEWGDKKDLVVKKLKDHQIDPPNMQYIEAHYQYKITELAMPHIVPLLYLYENPSDEIDFFIFLPRYKQSLFEYLEKNIQTIKPDEIIKISLDIANVLVKLHSYEIVHRDLKTKNILLDENNQCYLADFGTCKQTTINDTIVGTSPLAPDVHSVRTHSASNYNGSAVDIYSFGILLYELLPKEKYHRPHSSRNKINVKKLLESISPFDDNNNEYELLIELCLSEDAEQRPKALELVRKLEEIKKTINSK